MNEAGGFCDRESTSTYLTASRVARLDRPREIRLLSLSVTVFCPLQCPSVRFTLEITEHSRVQRNAACHISHERGRHPHKL